MTTLILGNKRVSLHFSLIFNLTCYLLIFLISFGGKILIFDRFDEQNIEF